MAALFSFAFLTIIIKARSNLRFTRALAKFAWSSQQFLIYRSIESSRFCVHPHVSYVFPSEPFLHLGFSSVTTPFSRECYRLVQIVSSLSSFQCAGLFSGCFIDDIEIDRRTQFMGIYGCFEVIYFACEFQSIDRKFIQISNGVSFCFHFVFGQIHFARSCAKIAFDLFCSWNKQLVFVRLSFRSFSFFGLKQFFILFEIKKKKTENEIDFACGKEQW